ncbi:hypothetical protein AOLI_G00190640 [Acnodon oligacanthus]
MRRHYRPSSGSERRTNPGAWGAAPPSAELSARCREVTEQPVRMLSAFPSWCSQRAVRATAATFSTAEPQFKTVGEREGPRDPHAALCSGRQNREIERQTPDLQRKRSRLLRSSVFGEFSSPQIPSLGGAVLVSLFQRRRRLEPVHRQGSARGPRKLSRLGFGRKSS